MNFALSALMPSSPSCGAAFGCPSLLYHCSWFSPFFKKNYFVYVMIRSYGFFPPCHYVSRHVSVCHRCVLLSLFFFLFCLPPHMHAWTFGGFAAEFVLGHVWTEGGATRAGNCGYVRANQPSHACACPHVVWSGMHTSLCGHKCKGDVLLRNDVSEFTPEELEALARMELNDGNDANGGVPLPCACISSSDGGGNRARKEGALLTLDRRGSRCTLRQLLPPEGLVGGVDSMTDAVLGTSQLHVEGRGLQDTSLVECFLNVTHLYLQHNHLTSLDGLSLLVQLTVLVVHHNAVETLRPLAELGALTFLDASFNAIRVLNPLTDLPPESLRYLSLLANPCCRTPSELAEERDAYRLRIAECCSHLEMLDDVPCRTPLNSFSSLSSSSSSWSASTLSSSGRNGVGASALTSIDAGQECDKKNDTWASSSILRSRIAQSLEMSRRKSLLRGSSCVVPSTHEHSTVTDRLFQQLQRRSSGIRRIAVEHASGLLSTDRTGWVGCSPKFDGNERDDGGPDVLPCELVQERQAKSRLYDDIRFALNAESARLQQLAGSVWEDVDKVIRTRELLVSERRERMRTRQQQPSVTYTEGLALLEKESHVASLDKHYK